MKPYVSVFKFNSHNNRRNRVSRYQKLRESRINNPVIPPRYIPLKERLNDGIEQKPVTPIVQNIFVFNINAENIEDVLPGILKCIKQAAL